MTAVYVQEENAQLRVSSKEQDKEGFSISAQRKLLREYAAQTRVDVVREFEDIETAKRAGRTGCGDLIAFLYACPGPKPVLLVEKTDRLYRNIKDWVTIGDIDLEIHLVKEAAILSGESRSSEKLMHGIRVLIAKNYIDSPFNWRSPRASSIWNRCGRNGVGWECTYPLVRF